MKIPMPIDNFGIRKSEGQPVRRGSGRTMDATTARSFDSRYFIRKTAISIGYDVAAD
jgi:hypothetical protein